MIVDYSICLDRKLLLVATELPNSRNLMFSPTQVSPLYSNSVHQPVFNTPQHLTTASCIINFTRSKQVLLAVMKLKQDSSSNQVNGNTTPAK